MPPESPQVVSVTANGARKGAATMGMDEMFGLMNKNTPCYMADTSAACDGAAVNTRGLLSGTYVATAMGWRPAKAITAGDMLVTFDNGLCPVVEVRREVFRVSEMMAPGLYNPVLVPAGALGNARDLELLPDQGVLIESEAACDAHGDPFAVVPAKALEGYRGIERIPARFEIEVITLVFGAPQVIYAEGGALIHCPPAQVRLSDLGMQKDAYDMPPMNEVAYLVECMVAEDRILQAA